VARIDRLAGISRLYLDANIFIYFIEGRGAERDAATDILLAAAERGVVLVTGEITIAECLHGAFKQKNEALASVYRDLLSGGIVVETLAGDPVLYECAAYAGSLLSLKLIDAIHAASAMIGECEGFLTNDRGIRVPDGIRIIQLADAA
jgi:predicted nucleic acid-binding protein